MMTTSPTPPTACERALTHVILSGIRAEYLP
jgi:hypothetical protein